MHMENDPADHLSSLPVQVRVTKRIRIQIISKWAKEDNYGNF